MTSGSWLIAQAVFMAVAVASHLALRLRNSRVRTLWNGISFLVTAARKAAAERDARWRCARGPDDGATRRHVLCALSVN